MITKNPIDDLQEEITSKMMMGAEKIKQLLVRQAQRVIDDEKVINSGDLRKSIDGEITRDADRIIIEIFSNMNYAYWAHEGTKPHYPPLHKIRDWVRKKGLAKKTMVRGKNQGKERAIRSYRSMNDYWQVDQVARAIAWKIAHHGTKGVKFFDLAVKQAEANIESILDKYSRFS